MRPEPSVKPAVAPPRAAVLAPRAPTPRERHYGEFYSLVDPPEGFGLVLGNCQAESVRMVIDSERTPTVRVPAVHELTAQDAERLHALAARAAFVVSQPIRDDYRDLPLGTRQIARSLPSTARLVTVPSVRFAGLHPFQAAIRVPGTPTDPPIAVYHDVRGLSRAAGVPVADELSVGAVRAIAAESLAELRRREAGCDVTVSDVLARPDFSMMRTVNHAGNPVWMALGERVLDALGAASAPTDPGRPLLASVIAPREDWVVAAWGTADEPTPDWTIEGVVVPAGEVRAAHARWYRENPAFVVRALERLAPTIARWRAS